MYLHRHSSTRTFKNCFCFCSFRSLCVSREMQHSNHCHHISTHLLLHVPVSPTEQHSAAPCPTVPQLQQDPANLPAAPCPRDFHKGVNIRGVIMCHDFFSSCHCTWSTLESSVGCGPESLGCDSNAIKMSSGGMFRPVSTLGVDVLAH